METRQGIVRLEAVLGMLACLWAGSAPAVEINNDVALGTLGHWSVNVTGAGESETAFITASGLVSGLVTTDILYQYFSYIDVGSGGQRLSGTSITTGTTLTGDDQVTSAGFFTGAVGNIINWTATSSIPDGEQTLLSAFTFSAQTGALGALRLFQYLDEDVDGFSDDAFFTRGSVAGQDLELFTVDDDQVFGLSHSGALGAAQGLVNAVFAGWAACVFDEMRPAIEVGTQSVSPTGDVCVDLAGLTATIPMVGSVLGPADIVSVLAWDVDPTATSATVITTTGGVPQAVDVSESNNPSNNPALPEPASIVLLGAGLMCLGAVLRLRKGSRQPS